jgi:catechol 2,3-dioxygenase-like lactoylglutathione lyase family enzyme
MSNEKKAVISSSLAVFLVSDLEKSQAYYRDVLGFSVNEWWAERDGLNGMAFKLLQAESPGDIRPNRAAKGSEHVWDVYAYVDGLEELFAEFKSSGAIFSYDLFVQEFDWGTWKEFAIKDPDGYVIGFGNKF